MRRISGSRADDIWVPCVERAGMRGTRRFHFHWKAPETMPASKTSHEGKSLICNVLKLQALLSLRGPAVWLLARG